MTVGAQELSLGIIEGEIIGRVIGEIGDVASSSLELLPLTRHWDFL